MEIQLNEIELGILFRQDPATQNDGGYQNFLVQLQGRTNRSTGALALSPSDIERIPRYAFDYGKGGWEDRLLGIFRRHLGSRLGRDLD